MAAAFHLKAADYYWVGGSGNWSDLNHWRLGSSGGSIPSIVPSSGDNIFFDANSGFTVGNNIVTLNANGFCNNMTWGAVANNPRFVTTSASFTVQLNGSLVLSPTTTYNLIFAFKGATAATLTTQGNVLGEFGMEIDKPGSSLTVADSLVVPAVTNVGTTNQVTLTSGTFDITGKKVTLWQFSSQNDNVRTLAMANANVLANFGYRISGLNKTINATGSTLYVYSLISDGGTYNKVTATNANGPNTIIINNTTFKSLTFSPASNIYSDIGFGNTVDTLVYNAAGSIGSNNTVGRVRFGQGGSIDGTGNVIRSITCLNNFVVSGNYTNTVDSMTLAPNRITQFRGTVNINDYLYVAGAACDAYTEINGDSTAGTVNFAAGATVNISNVILTGVKATGPGIPFAVNGIDGTGNAGFTITEPSTTGTTLYWVGGAGNWNDRNHWSTSSGGTGGACVPFKSDNVVFDANSGLAGRTVTTSSSSFCKDMTWGAGVGTVVFNESSTSSFRVYGSVVMQPTVTMNTGIEFYGGDAITITTNGGGAGSLHLIIVKTGSGSVTLMDNWINNGTASAINFYSGNLSLAGRTVTCWIFVSNNNITRSLDISNATITTNLRWIYLGGNKSITATGSHITSHAQFQANNPGSNYPWVDLTEARTETNGDFNISGSTFGQLTFTSTAATSIARILSSNTIRRLEFKGSGTILGGNNNLDTLILTGSRNYSITGISIINKYFKAEATTCSGLTEIRGYPVGTLTFTSGVDVDIANVYLQNMTATGAITPIAFNGADAGGNTGWTITSPPGGSRYWVGGAGDWNDPNHWSATSGGTGGACIPTVSDNVYFDAGSGFTAVSKTVTVNNGNAYCRNLDWTGAANAPVWSKSASWTMEVWGNNVILNSAATFNSVITLKGANAASLQGTVLGNFDVNIDKPGGSLTLLNNFNNIQTGFVVYNGAFIASGRTLNVEAIDNAALNNVTRIDISNSKITTSVFRYTGTIANHTLNAANSSITTGIIYADGLQYDTVNVANTASDMARLNSTNIRRLTFTNPSTSSAIGINGNNNTFNRVEYKGSGGIYGTGNVMDTLIFFPGNTYTLNAGSNTTINDAWYGSGTPCRATEIISSSTSANATITKNSGDVNFDYVRLRRVTAAGTAAPFVARSHSTNLGNNVSWNIAPYDGAAPIYGLGPDTTVPVNRFPHVLRTDGFFGAPSSQYTWNDNSTADTLLVTGPGTYSVSVDFVDGCSISDAIIVAQGAVLPITLERFTGNLVNCQPRLSWKVADAIQFSHFVVERSTDGENFSAIADLPYTGAAEYRHTDLVPENGTNHYRLKLVDLDGAFANSRIVSVNMSCALNQIAIYPTITRNRVQIVLPVGNKGPKIQLYNISGQQVNRVAQGSGTLRTIDLAGLPNGMYVLQVINGIEIRSFKVQKQ